MRRLDQSQRLSKIQGAVGLKHASSFQSGQS